MASTTGGCRVFLGNSRCVSAVKGNTLKVIWMLGLRCFFFCVFTCEVQNTVSEQLLVWMFFMLKLINW